MKSPANVFNERIQQECTIVMSFDRVPHFVLPDVSRTDWKQHVSAFWAKKRNGEERRFTLKAERERETRDSPHFLSLFFFFFYCRTHAGNGPTKDEDHLIPVFRLSRSNFWQAVMCNHRWIARTPMDWSNTVGRRVVRLRAKTNTEGREVSIDEELLVSSAFSVEKWDFLN